MASHHQSDRVATVLLVDQNPEVAFGLRATLSKQPQLQLVEVADHAQALEVLMTQVVDVIVACVRAPEEQQLQLLQQVRQQEHLAALPLLLITEDDRVASKVTAFRNGATDYVTRPFAMSELVARVEAAVSRQLGSNHPSRRDGCLGGDLQTIAFTDLVHLLQIGQRTGKVTLLTSRTTGQVLFVGGQVYHATFGTMIGEEAFYRQVYESRGHFEFRPCDFDLASVRNTVALGTTTLLMEAARRHDSWRRDHPDEGDQPDPVENEAPPVVPNTVLPAVPGVASAADELQHLLEGEAQASLLLLDRDQLPAFTGATTTAGRCMVLLVADGLTAIAAACNAAGPAGPEFIEQALGCGQKVLVLRWLSPSGAMLDVMLLDQEFPGYVLNEIRLQPTAIIVAPRNGDWFALSLLSQNELGSMLAHLRPRCLIGLGDREMVDGLDLLQQRADVEADVHCLPTPLEHWASLRAALSQVLRRWAAIPAAEPAVPTSEA